MKILEKRQNTNSLRLNRLTTHRKYQVSTIFFNLIKFVCIYSYNWVQSLTNEYLAPPPAGLATIESEPRYWALIGQLWIIWLNTELWLVDWLQQVSSWDTSVPGQTRVVFHIYYQNKPLHVITIWSQRNTTSIIK